MMLRDGYMAAPPTMTVCSPKAGAVKTPVATASKAAVEAAARNVRILYMESLSSVVPPEIREQPQIRRPGSQSFSAGLMNETTRDAEIALWLARTAEGDRAAFAALYRHSSPKLMGLVRRILLRSDLAEEALQEAYVRIWSNAAQFDSALSRPMTWMAAIARNAAIDSRRR